MPRTKRHAERKIADEVIIPLPWTPPQEALRLLENVKFSELFNGWRLRHEELPGD